MGARPGASRSQRIRFWETYGYYIYQGYAENSGTRATGDMVVGGIASILKIAAYAADLRSVLRLQDTARLSTSFRKASRHMGGIHPKPMRAAVSFAFISSSYITTPHQVPFLLAHAAPDPVHLAGPQGEIQAFGPDRAPCANLLRLRYLLQGTTG